MPLLISIHFYIPTSTDKHLTYTVHEIDILQESATETTPNTNYASMVAMETNILIFRF